MHLFASQQQPGFGDNIKQFHLILRIYNIGDSTVQRVSPCFQQATKCRDEVETGARKERARGIGAVVCFLRLQRSPDMDKGIFSINISAYLRSERARQRHAVDDASVEVTRARHPRTSSANLYNPILYRGTNATLCCASNSHTIIFLQLLAFSTERLDLYLEIAHSEYSRLHAWLTCDRKDIKTTLSHIWQPERQHSQRRQFHYTPSNRSFITSLRTPSATSSTATSKSHSLIHSSCRNSVVYSPREIRSTAHRSNHQASWHSGICL